MNSTAKCYITNTIDEDSMCHILLDVRYYLRIPYPATGTLAVLPGNNPVQDRCYEDYVDSSTPALLSPVFVYNGSTPPAKGTVSIPETTSTVAQAARGTCIQKAGAVLSISKPMPLLLTAFVGTIGFSALYLL
jgi:hypothetical protein